LIDLAQGEYIAYLDADDFSVEAEAFEERESN
jgi:hypothetical protein